MRGPPSVRRRLALASRIASCQAGPGIEQERIKCLNKTGRNPLEPNIPNFDH
jgi:hypothetical protein